YLPRTDKAATAPQPRPALGDLHGSETILVIEDEEQVRSAVQRVLERLGYSVLVACDGAQAVETARAYSGRIDLVLSDVVVPGGSGPDVVKEIIERSPATKTLFMSGYTDHAVLRAGK